MSLQPTVGFLGLTLTLEVGYSSSKEQEAMVLAVKGLPQNLPPKLCKSRLVKYFSNHAGFKATDCRIIESVAYLSFDDKSGQF